MPHTLKPTAMNSVTAHKNAQSHFTASQRRDLEVRKEIELQQDAVAIKTAKLRALRIAREESDRQASADEGQAKKALSKKQKVKK